MSERKSGFALMLTISLAVAGAAFAGPFFDVLHQSNGEVAPRMILLFLEVLPALWGILLVVALFRYRFRGLWLLLGLPLSLWWLIFNALLGLGGI